MTAITMSLAEVPESAHGLLFVLREHLIRSSMGKGETYRHWEDALRALVSVRRIKETADIMADFEKADPVSEPRYLMVLGGKEERFYELKEAGKAFDCGWMPVTIGPYVLEPDLRLRPVTEEDNRAISCAADDYSARK